MAYAKKQKWILFTLAAVLAGIILLLAARKDPQEQVAAFVLEHRAELETVALAHLAGNDAVSQYKRVTVDGTYGAMVQFTYAASGLVPSSRYRGFYYAADGAPAAFQGAHVLLEQTADGEWTWTDGTDNGGVTKQLNEHWFYYEAWF